MWIGYFGDGENFGEIKSISVSQLFLTSIFELLAQNKKLPYYQAERRIDIFINIYLEEILNAFLKSTSIQFIAPEFPLKKKGNAASTKVDYLCLDDITKEIYFVELKTDNSPFKPSQLDIYRDNLQWNKCIDGLHVIFGKNDKGKYKEKFSLLNNRLNHFNLLSNNSMEYKIKIVNILPNVTDEEKEKNNDLLFITFEDLESFKPKNHSEEWNLFLKHIIKQKLN
ncbi:MAG: hypothetical protein JWQ09_219 [Segetibacter sp.]|nr:hypothetical protein [Segetibacter sp.]